MMRFVWLGEVREDWIAHYAPFARVALTCLRTRHFEVGGTVLMGWRFYDGHTDEGLRNDLFGTARFTEFRLETRIKL